MIVDSHVHLLPDRLGAAIRRFFAQFMTANGALAYPYEHAAARAAIVAAGVTRCWTLPYARRPGMASALNRWMAETWADDPVVVAGGTVHPADDVGAVLSEALDDLRLPLLKLHCSVGEFEPDDARLDTVWRRVSARGTPVVVHVGHGVLGNTEAHEIAPVARVARRWPEARIVVAHCGAPAVAETLALLRATRSVHADLTPVGRTPVPIDRAMLAGLERRLLFGSDAPNTAIPIEDSIATVRALGLDGADEGAILGGTAERLLGR